MLKVPVRLNKCGISVQQNTVQEMNVWDGAHNDGVWGGDGFSEI